MAIPGTRPAGVPDPCLPHGFCACPVDIALDLVGKKWTALIIRNLLRGDRHFNRLLANIEGLTPKILSTRLKELEHEGVVRKRVSATPPVSVEYGLTQKGYAMLPILRQMVRWSLTYAPDRVFGKAGKPRELEKALEAWQSVILAKGEALVLGRKMDVVTVRWTSKR